MATTKKASKKDYGKLWPVDYGTLPDGVVRCHYCDWGIAGHLGIVLKDHLPYLFCRPECAWYWAQKEKLTPRKLEKAKPASRKTHGPVETS